MKRRKILSLKILLTGSLCRVNHPNKSYTVQYLSFDFGLKRKQVASMWRTANYIAMLSYFINVITYLENQGLFGICWRLFTVSSQCIYCFGTCFWQANRFATSREKHLKRHLSKHSDSTVHTKGKSQMNDSYPIGWFFIHLTCHAEPQDSCAFLCPFSAFITPIFASSSPSSCVPLVLFFGPGIMGLYDHSCQLKTANDHHSSEPGDHW